MPSNLTPPEIAEVASKAAKRLLVAAEAVQRVTWGMNLDRPAAIPATGAK